jgi:methionyl-tRNA formyltransferase
LTGGRRKVPSLNIVFAGSSDFAVTSLEALLAAHHRVCAVLTQPDRPAGRRRKPTPTPLKLCARRHGLAILEPVTLRDRDTIAALAALEPDVIVVVDYGLIIPPPVLRLPSYGCLNGHASLLPRWRGAAPIERALLAGDANTGITVMQMDEGLDTGDVLLIRTTPIGARETAGELRQRLARICAEALTEALSALQKGQLEARPQASEGICYAAKLDTAEGRLDWGRPAAELDRVVRAFNPRPGAFTDLRGQRLKILTATPLKDAAGAAPGTVTRAAKTGIDVATGVGTLRITRLQMAGRQPVSADVFINGYDVQGASLGSSSS